MLIKTKDTVTFLNDADILSIQFITPREKHVPDELYRRWRQTVTQSERSETYEERSPRSTFLHPVTRRVTKTYNKHGRVIEKKIEHINQRGEILWQVREDFLQATKNSDLWIDAPELLITLVSGRYHRWQLNELSDDLYPRLLHQYLGLSMKEVFDRCLDKMEAWESWETRMFYSREEAAQALLEMLKIRPDQAHLNYVRQSLIGGAT